MRARSDSPVASRPVLRGRGGYTLVELVVVMGIIAALAALILGAVAKVKDSGDRTKVRSELSQLDTAVAAFKQDHGFNPPHVVTFPVPMQPRSPAQEKAVQLLSKMFRGYDPNVHAISYRGATGTATQPLKLEGIQSLVFFLGGPNGTGFKKATPEAATPDTNSKTGPYYDFAEARFADPDTRQPTSDYRDIWGTPYAYFASGTIGGDKYDAAYYWTVPDRSGILLGAFRTSKTPYLPYPTPATFNRADFGPWLNPGRVQIISAGPNKLFGGQAYLQPDPLKPGANDGGNVWVPGRAEYSDLGEGLYYPPHGADDLANFNGTAPLGTPGN